MPKLLILLAGLPLLMAGALASADYAIIDVREKGPDGHHFLVPVPLAVARMALAFAPAEARAIDIPPAAARHLAAAGAGIAALERVPDCVLIEVEERGQRVLVRKSGADLIVDVRGPAEVVHLRLPLRAAREVLAGSTGGKLRTTDALAALGRVSGELLRVDADDAEVRIRVW